jgi:multidrug efflux pump subunit AcrB
MPAVRVEFVQILEDVLNDLSGNPRPIEIRMVGEDHAELARLAGEVEKRLDGTPDMVDYYRGVEDNAPVARYTVDAVAAAVGGLSPADVADDLATALAGRTVGDVPRFDRLVPVRVRFPDEWRFRPDRLPDLPLAIGKDTVPVSHLARLTRDARPSQLIRENLLPAAIATSDVEGGDVGGLTREVRRRLTGLVPPRGYRIEIGGQAESQGVAFRQLLVVFAVGIVAVFALLVAQLRSARAALLVLLTLPPALSGALLSLRLTGVPMNVSSLMGLVLLVGLVVKNGILLVENAVRRTEVGEPLRVAIRGAGRRRLRPILMTTLCTVFGLLPLAFAFGAGSELQRPLAVAVIGGLVFSTGATLFLLPALAGTIMGTSTEGG